MLPVSPPRMVSMYTRDRVRLDADVYTPDAAGDFPVLLMRQPYGRAIASTVVYAHPTWYAAQGYIVVIQDVRGRGTSEGEFRLFASETEDGYDAVNWAASLPQSTGRVGMYGFSYQGMTQLYAATAQPEALKAIAPAMVGYNPYTDWAYENGALCLQAGLGWAIQLAAETARRKGDVSAYQRLYAASRNLPLYDPIPARPEILTELAPDSFFHDWLDHPEFDDYWQALTPQLAGVDLPMLHVGGWFDPYLRGDLRLFREMCDRSAHLQHLWIGPWGHIPWGRKAGGVDFGPDAESPIDALQIRWFDHVLKVIETGLGDEPSVRLFEMGTNQWRKFAHWPTGQTQSYALKSTGLAGIRQDNGSLVETATAVNRQPVVETRLTPSANSEDVIVHDPWRPVPSLGGHAAFPSGSFDRSAIDCRSDVMTYTTAPLTAGLTVVGEGIVEVYCAADAPSFDLCAVLSEVRTNGAVYNLTQGYRRIDEHSDLSQSVEVPLHPTCFHITKGNALRLSLSAACFPAYAVNPGTGEPLRNSQLINARIITLVIHSGQEYPSNVTLRLCWE